MWEPMKPAPPVTRNSDEGAMNSGQLWRAGPSKVKQPSRLSAAPACAVRREQLIEQGRGAASDQLAEQPTESLVGQRVPGDLGGHLLDGEPDRGGERGADVMIDEALDPRPPG